MQPDEPRSAIPFHQFLLLIASAAVALGAFWLLLGYRYSPESYNSYAITPGILELIWISLAVVAAIVGLVLLLSKRGQWPAAVRSAMPIGIVSVWILSKGCLHAPLRCYDMILFCVGFGWATGLWAKQTQLFHSAGWGDDTWRTRLASLIVWGLVLTLGAYYVWQQMRYWNNLALGYADCGYETSIIYNTVSHPRELFLTINPNHPMFWDHFYPGVLAFVPLWWLWPDFRMIIVLEVVIVVGVALPLYWIGKQVFRERIAALLLVLGWLAFPSTSQFIYSASYGFRWGNVCLPLYFFALAFWMKGRKGWALGTIIWALLIKEEAAIVIGMFGLYLALFERRRALGLAIMASAFAYFLIVSTVMIPRLQLGYYRQLFLFADLGRNMWEILWSPFTKPRIFWGKLFEPRSWYFAAVLLAPLLFFPLKKPSILVIGSLTFVFDCMHPMMKSICYQYQAALLPVVFWALAAALQPEPASRRHGILAGVIASGLLLSLFLGNTFWSKDSLPMPVSPGRLALVKRIGRDIHERDSLLATQRIAAHFIKQRAIYVAPPLPNDLDYAFLDLQDIWQTAINLGWFGRLRDLQRQVEAVPGMHLVAAEDGLLLYSRRGPKLDAQHLVERDALPENAQRQTMDLGCGVRIEGFTLAPAPSPNDLDSDVVRVTAYSAVVASTNADLAVCCTVQVDTGTQESERYASVFKPLGQGVWPVARWETNKFYADDYLITLPKGLANRIARLGFEMIPLKP